MYGRLLFKLSDDLSEIRHTLINSEGNFQSIHMNIMHIWPKIKISILLWPFNDLKRLIVTFWPKKMAKPNTDSESWDNFTQTPSFGCFIFYLHNAAFITNKRVFNNLITTDVLSKQAFEMNCIKTSFMILEA